MHKLIPLFLFLAALAAPASSWARGDITVTDYKVVIEGSADYNRADVDGDASAQHDEAVDFTTTIPRLSFYGDSAEDSTGALGTASVSRGSYVITGESGSVGCGVHTIVDSTAGGLDATSNAAGFTTFAARVVDSFTVEMSGCGLDAMNGWQVPFTSGGEEVGIGIFDGAFTMPNEMVGQGQMVFPLSGEVTGSSCPGAHINTVLCSLTWDATVTFTKTGVREEDIPLVPLGPEPSATPAPTAPPVDPDADLLVPLGTKAKLAKGLDRATFPVDCPAGCRGTVTATARGRKLAKGRFSAPAGGVARAVVRFDRADRRVIRRAGRVKLRLKATNGESTVRRSVTLRA